MRYDRRWWRRIQFTTVERWQSVTVMRKQCYKKSANFFLPPLFPFIMVDEKSKKIMRIMRVLGIMVE